MSNSTDLQWAELLDEADEKIEALTEALDRFVKQWEACGPNSDFGRYFAPVYEQARATLAVAGRSA